jgi:nitrogen regulatory protein PII
VKKVETIIFSEHLGQVQLALADAGISGLSVFEGGQFITTADQSGALLYEVAPRLKLEIFCEDHEAARIAQIIASQAHDRARPPVRVFMSSAEESVKMRLPTSEDPS